MSVTRCAIVSNVLYVETVKKATRYLALTSRRGKTSSVLMMGLKTHKINLEGDAMHMALGVDGPAELGFVQL